MSYSSTLNIKKTCSPEKFIPTKPHDVIFQKTVMFTGLFTIMRISNLAYINFDSNCCSMPIHVNKKELFVNYKHD